MAPILHGGGQEDGYRSGTENTPGILGLGEAVRAYPKDGPAEMMANKRLLWQLIQERIPSAKLNGPELDDHACAPHILNVSFPPCGADDVFALEGMAFMCPADRPAPGRKQKLSSVLTAMGLSTERIDSCPALQLVSGTYGGGNDLYGGSAGGTVSGVEPIRKKIRNGEEHA